MRKSFLIAAILVACVTPTSKAALIVDFGQSSYGVAPGASVDVQVFIRQTGVDSILSDEGLFSAGLQVRFNLPPFNSDPAQVTAVVANPAFNTVTAPPPTPASGTSSGSADLEVADFSATGAVFPTMNRILLGTFTFQAGLTGTTLIDVADLNPGVGFDDFITGAGTILDDQLTFGTTQIQITGVVPEPGSLTLAMIAVAGGLVLVRRHRGR